MSSNLSGKVISSSFIYNKASDHKIVKLKLASDVDKGPGMWVFNNTLLTDREFTNLISVTIRNLVLNRRNLNVDNKYFWDILKQKIVSVAKEYSKKKAMDERKLKHTIEKELESLEKLHSQKLSPGILDRIDYLHGKINDYQKKKLQGALIR